eukprot:snap_masked-scaffold_26-processed-gene-1.28-mRNA-1 protein AED:1.00 eAED:1.00 QI:0/0/0/0/1/1/2/0/212
METFTDEEKNKRIVKFELNVDVEEAWEGLKDTNAFVEHLTLSNYTFKKVDRENSSTGATYSSEKNSYSEGDKVVITYKVTCVDSEKKQVDLLKTTFINGVENNICAQSYSLNLIQNEKDNCMFELVKDPVEEVHLETVYLFVTALVFSFVALLVLAIRLELNENSDLYLRIDGRSKYNYKEHIGKYFSTYKTNTLRKDLGIQQTEIPIAEPV